MAEISDIALVRGMVKITTYNEISQQMLVRMQRKGNPLILLVGMQTGAATLENSMEVPQKVKKITTLWSSNCIMRYLPKDYKNTDLKGRMHTDVYSSIINNSQIMERAQISVN